MASSDSTSLDPIGGVIRWIRGQKVILDEDLAHLYGVETKALNQAVRRNQDRFPEDFMFQLSPAEAAALRSRFVTLEGGRGRHRKYAPYAFTEQGVAMLSSMMRGEQTVRANIEIMRAFVRTPARRRTQVCARHGNPGPLLYERASKWPSRAIHAPLPPLPCCATPFLLA